MKPSVEQIRIDKWLWAVRLFKSRALAAQACEKGKIRIQDQPVKASRNIKAGEIISIRRGPFVLQYEVIQITANRIPAKAFSEFCKDVTPKEELEKIRLHLMNVKSYQNRGEGRPTKKDRRELDSFLDF